ncbi:MAG: response regulator, partial [Planctomycetota bacterium]
MGKVLITDDDPVQRTMLHSLIEKMKHTAIMAANGKQAYDLLEMNPDIDLLITDIYMPEMDG